MAQFRDYVAQFRGGNRQMFIYGILLVVFGVLVFLASTKLLLSYRENQERIAQMNSMQAFVTEFNAKAAKLNKEPYRAVLEAQVDDVQSNLILALQAHKLNLVSLHNMTKKGDKNPTGKQFELVFQGVWADVVHFLNDFHVKDALIGISEMKMEPQNDGTVKTTLHYKIFTK